jgi:hypothetical protein
MHASSGGSDGACAVVMDSAPDSLKLWPAAPPLPRRHVCRVRIP